MNTNFWGGLNTIQEILPHFLARKTGTIVNVGSIGGKMPLPQMTAYCASKYAVTGLTETLRLELAPQGIHVCAVHPGLINSDFLERSQFRDRGEPAVELRRQQMSDIKSGCIGIINLSILSLCPLRPRKVKSFRYNRKRYEMLKSDWANQPEDIAQSIWDAVKNQRAEVTVWPAFLASEAYRLFPGLMQWAMEKGNHLPQ